MSHCSVKQLVSKPDVLINILLAATATTAASSTTTTTATTTAVTIITAVGKFIDESLLLFLLFCFINLIQYYWRYYFES
jgi:Mg2+/Co2+ transporter CorB